MIMTAKDIDDKLTELHRISERLLSLSQEKDQAALSDTLLKIGEYINRIIESIKNKLSEG